MNFDLDDAMYSYLLLVLNLSDHPSFPGVLMVLPDHVRVRLVLHVIAEEHVKAEKGEVSRRLG